MGSKMPWVDDRDARVRFNGVWIPGGSPKEYLETVSSSTRVGDSFIVPFYGKSIVVYGTIDSTSGGVVTNYSIDGRPAEQVTSQRGTGDTFHQQFWASPVLDVIQHELTVTMAKVNPDPEPGEGTIWFDYFVVSDPSGHEGLPPKKIPKGAIVGGVLGGVVFLACILVSVVLCLRRRKRRKEAKLQEEHQRFREFGYPGYDKEIREDRDLTGERWGRPSWVHAQRQRQSRNGIQPFVLGISAPPNSSQSASVSPPRPVWPRDQKGRGIRKTLLSNNLQTSESSRVSSSPGVLARASSSVEPRGNTTTPSDVRPRSPSSPSDVDESVSGGSGSVAISPPVTRSAKLNRGNSQRQFDHQLNRGNPQRRPDHQPVAPSSLGLVTSDSGSVTVLGDDDVGQGSAGAVVTAVNEPQGRDSHESPREDGSRPVIRVVTGVNGEGDSADQGIAPVQHVDSGVRLEVEEVRLPAELPPVYSPT